MKQQILFVQGGGDDGYHADQVLVNGLRNALGVDYIIDYPELLSDHDDPDFGWIDQISRLISDAGNDLIIVAHSFGASMILKLLSERTVHRRLMGVFLIATPFWEGGEDWKKGFILQQDFAARLPEGMPFFFYQSKDDGEVPYAHFERYQRKFPNAVFYNAKTGGHQFSAGLNKVAADIRSLNGEPE